MNVVVKALAGCALVLSAGCIMADGTTPKADVPEGGMGYTLIVTAVGNTMGFAERPTTCDITGFAGQEVVTITDFETGEVRPYEIEIDFVTPRDIEIVSVPGVQRIQFVCSMQGRRNDSLRCEVKTSQGVAVVLDGMSARQIDWIDSKNGLASCFGVIQVTLG